MHISQIMKADYASIPYMEILDPKVLRMADT